jgi:hypothetical protein
MCPAVNYRLTWFASVPAAVLWSVVLDGTIPSCCLVEQLLDIPFLFCFVLFVLFCFVLFCFVLFCFIYFILFYFVLFCFVLFCFVLF